MPKPLKILQASAGSGKTFSLAAHYLTLLFSNDNKYREVLAVTFTNKATEEMKTRILEVLKGLATSDPKVDSYRKIIQPAYPDLSSEALQLQAHNIYRKILHDYSRFSVSTIDGFVQKVIRGFTFELGLSADYSLELNLDKVKDELIEALEAQLTHNPQLLDWVIQIVMDKIQADKSWNFKEEFKKIVSEIFQERFEDFEQSIENLASKNADKSKPIGSKPDPEVINKLFSEYSTQTRMEIKGYEDQLKEKVNQALNVYSSLNVDISNLNGKSKSWLTKIGTLLEDDDKKTDKILELVDQPETWFAKNKVDIDFYNRLNPVLSELKTFIYNNIGRYRLALAFMQNLYYLRLMQEVVQLLAAYRSENDNLLISDAQKLVTGITDDADENPSFIWEKIGNRYRNFLFDEFQDTSTRQWKSFKALLLNTLSTATGDQIDHLIVGDAKQSIYRWRSGDWNILHRQAKTDVGPEYVVEDRLEENYRSTRNIIAFNNFLYNAIPAILQDSINNLVKEKSIETDKWWREEARAYDKIITNVYKDVAQECPAGCLDGGMIKVERVAPDESSDSSFAEVALRKVSNEIVALVNEYGYQFKDIALLVRSNAEASLCVNHLMELGYPVLSGDALLLANNTAIDLLVNTLKILSGLDSQTAIYKANCIALYHAAHEKEVDTAWYFHLTENDLSALSYALPASLCENWKAWAQLPLAELTETIFECYGLTSIPRYVPYLLAFRDLVSRATKNGEIGIVPFLEWWEEEGSKQTLPSPEDANAIQIITIHKSKGLAFRAVFIPFCDWDIKPRANGIFWVSALGTPYEKLGSIPLMFNGLLERSFVANAYFEELLYGGMDNLNMLYVATTRAIDFLHICIKGQKVETKVSNIGLLINMAVCAKYPEFSDTNLFESGTVLVQSSVTVGNNRLRMNDYPTSQRLSELFEPKLEDNLSHLLDVEKQARKGVLSHQVLANATNEDEINSYLGKLIDDGIVKQEEVGELRESAMSVMNDPQIVDLFSNANYSITEKNIIDTHGKMLRPDRIMVYDNKMILLDYKFTNQKSKAHEKQVLQYKKLLEQMGYRNIYPYLFYAETKELYLVN